MKNNDFSEKQLEDVKNFIKLSKSYLSSKKISSSFLLYIISCVPSENNETIFTKSNKLLLKKYLPLKKRLRIEFLIRELEK